MTLLALGLAGSESKAMALTDRLRNWSVSGPQWTPAIVFGFLIAILVLRPRGLLGEETREAG